MQFVYSEGYIPGDLIEQDREQLEKEIKVAEAEFRNVLYLYAPGTRFLRVRAPPDGHKFGSGQNGVESHAV